MIDDPLQPYQTPPVWTPDHVMHRMLWAFDALRRLRIKTGPGGYGSGWPSYVHEWEDLLAQEETEAAENKRNRYRERDPVMAPSALDIDMMEEAFGWPFEFLLWDRAPGVLIVEWALFRSRGWNKPTDINRVQIEAALIAAGLRQKRVIIR